MHTAVTINPDECEFKAIRAQGPGGQNVNKVSNAIHLTFDLHRSSLPEDIKQGLLSLRDHHISKDGVIHIKAQKFRSLPKNRDDALRRLQALIDRASTPVKVRTATKATWSSVQKRLSDKSRRSRVKNLRQGKGSLLES